MRTPLLLPALAALFLLGAETTQPAESTQPAAASSAPAGQSYLSLEPPAKPSWSHQTPLSTVFTALGAEAPSHARTSTPEQIQQGRELFTTGRTTGPDGSLVKKQSRAFECTDCHNMVREDPDLRVSDPEARLTFAEEQDLPFLPGTTMYGTVNRASWFNEDYFVKYGDFVKPANESLVEALQLCSTECSQGRRLEDWEIDAMLAFLWSIELRWGDLPPGDISVVQAEAAATRGDATQKADALAAVRRLFLPASPASFSAPPAEHGRKDPGYGLAGDPEQGRIVYERACTHCHGPGGPSIYRLNDSRCKYGELRLNQGMKTHWSFYVAIRDGTHPEGGRYMPLFTLERMSDQQVADLAAFIEGRAKGDIKRGQIEPGHTQNPQGKGN